MRVENFLCLEGFSTLGKERNQNETFYILRPVLGLAEKFLNRGKSSTRNETLLIFVLVIAILENFQKVKKIARKIKLFKF